MSSLHALYEHEGPDLLARLHERTGINRKYLYQIATRRRRPSPELASKLRAADSRLTLDGLLLSFADEPKGAA
ncbi:MAG TPA: hypothetical protein PK725_12605 [Rhodocyclaceae bacterium]|nr:hypothetical protein [Rhodocyclaceae bacterium]